MAWAVLVVALAGLLLWLSGTADETIAGLHADVDREGLRTTVELTERPPPPDPPARAEATEEAAADEEPEGAPDEPGEQPDAAEEPASEPETAADETEPADAGGPETAEQGTALDLTEDSAAEQEEQLALVEPPAPEVSGDLEGAVPPWQAHSRPFDTTDDRPRIAIVVTDLGLSATATQLAIQDLPGEVTLAFAAHSNGLDTWIPQARAAGHEALVMVPMEPEGYPGDDPGPYTLLTALAPTTNIDRLDWSLRRATGFVGIIDTNGSRFTGVPDAVTPIVEEIGGRGLMVVDTGSNEASVMTAVARENEVPAVVSDSFVTDFASGDAIDLRLAELEEIASERGWAVGVAFPYPILFDRMKTWIGTLEEKGIVLAPITAVAQEAG